MKAAKVKEAYKSLKLIVIKDRFLIPQKPPRVLRAHIQFYNYYRQLLKKDQRYAKNAALMNEAIKKEMNESNPVYRQFVERFRAQASENREKMQQYQDDFISPTKKILNLKDFFLKKNLKEPRGENVNPSDHFILKVKEFQAMRVEDRQILNKEFDEFQSEEAERYRKFAEKHEIPSLPHLTTYLLFAMKYTQNNPNFRKFTPELGESYRKLSPEELNELKEEKEKYISHSKAKYENFLERWNLTHESLTYTRQICAKYNEIWGKNSKKMQKIVKKLGGKQEDDEVQLE